MSVNANTRDTRKPCRKSGRPRSSAFLLLLLLVASQMILLLQSFLGEEALVEARCFNLLRDQQQSGIPVLIGHRGSRFISSENTIRAFDTVLQLGADVLEMDVQLTADGELVVFHDEQLERTTNINESALWKDVGESAATAVQDATATHVRNYTVEQLQKLDAAYKFTCGEGYPLRGRGIRIPRFAEVLARYWGPQRLKKSSGGGAGNRLDDRDERERDSRPRHVFFNVEIKNEEAAAADRLAEIIAQYDDEWVANHLVVANANCAALEYFRRRTKWRIPTGACEGEALRFMARAKFTALLLPLRELLFGKLRTYDQVPDSEKSMHPCALQIPVAIAGARLDFTELITLAHHEGMQVHYWVINSPREMARLADLGADGLLTDRIDLASEWMQQAGMGNKRWRVVHDPFHTDEPHQWWARGVEEEPWECLGLLCHIIEHAHFLAPIAIVLLSWLVVSMCWRRATPLKSKVEFVGQG